MFYYSIKLTTTISGLQPKMINKIHNIPYSCASVIMKEINSLHYVVFPKSRICILIRKFRNNFTKNNSVLHRLILFSRQRGAIIPFIIIVFL